MKTPNQGNRNSRIGWQSAALALISVAGWVIFANLADLFTGRLSGIAITARLSVLDLFVTELCLVVVAGIWLGGGGPVARGLGYLISFSFLLILGAQLQSLAQAQIYLPRLAIENFESIDLVLTKGTIFRFSLFCIFFLAGIVLLEKYTSNNRHRRVVPSILLLAIAVVTANTNSWVPPQTQLAREQFLSERHLPHTSPVFAIYQEFQPRKAAGQLETSWTDALEAGHRLGFQYDGLSQYPLLKNSLYSGDLPFPKTAAAKPKPNIVLIFVEGLSARLLGSYGGNFQGLTPNLDSFAAEAMRVTNYFNHTAATYRGILGQLCSAFPAEGGARWLKTPKRRATRNYLCLNQIFSENGYETRFIDSGSGQNQRSYLDEMADVLGFDVVLNGDEISTKFLKQEELGGYHSNSLSDSQMMRALVTLLQQESRAKTYDQPKLTVLYTANTHAFVDATEDGSRFGSGDNISLNTIHSFDQAFGVFWNYFRDSELAQSTVLILTTDHAHFPEPAYIEVAGADYQRWFVDKVPLLILDPTHELPNVYDAGVRSSIDLAPSILHLLEFPAKRVNSFLGTSLFEVRSGENGLAAGAIRPDVYLFEQETMHINLPRMRPPELMDGLSVFIDNLYQLDTTQRIWPADESSAKRYDAPVPTPRPD